jgi:hypothetical protein
VSHPLLERLTSGDPHERERACGDAVDDPSAVLFGHALAQALGDPVPAVAAAAAQALTRLGEHHDVRPPVLEVLHGADPRARLEAALTLATLEPPSLRLLRPLADGLALPDRQQRWRAARMLVSCGRVHAEVLPLLLGLARGDERARVRRMACHALRELAPADPEVAQALCEATADADLLTRRAAYTALTALIDPPRAVIETLLAALDNEPDPPSRRSACLALARWAPTASPELRSAAVAALRRALATSQDSRFRRGAEHALERLAEAQP